MLTLIETIAGSGATGVIYVSHRQDELPGCITHWLYLKSGKVHRAGAASSQKKYHENYIRNDGLE